VITEHEREQPDVLAERFASGDDHKSGSLHQLGNVSDYRLRRHELALARVLRVARGTLEIAPSEPNEHCGVACQWTLALDGVEDAVYFHGAVLALIRLLDGLDVDVQDEYP
jgi:hypothetical protein